MNTEQLVKEVKIKAQENGKEILRYAGAENIDENMIYVDGKWTTLTSAWGIVNKDNEWISFETDEERGYICGIHSYSTEEDACKGTYEYFCNLYQAEEDGYTDRDMTIRYVQNVDGYSKEKAANVIDRMMHHDDIFEEYNNYTISEEFDNDLKSIEVEGFTAKQLVEEKDFTPTAAYRFLVKLRENAEKAKKELEEGTAERK